MLADLKFVVGSVAKKDYVPELTHIKIKGGWAQGFNGTISAATRIDLDIDVMPWASEMIEAIQACTDTVALSVTEKGRLSVRSGKFRCFVDCLPMSDEVLQSFPTPEGKMYTVTEQFIEMLRALQPFMATDASRPWAMGIMLQQNSSFATNNVMLAEYWHGLDLGVRVTIPAEAVNEILKRTEAITAVQVSDQSLTVWFGRTRWLRTQLIEGEFPEALYSIIEAPGEPGIQVEQYTGFFEALDTLKRFTDDTNLVVFEKGGIATSKEEDVGALVVVDNLPQGLAFNLKHLSILKDAAAKIDFTPFPAPCRFWGKSPRLRGVFTGRTV